METDTRTTALTSEGVVSTNDRIALWMHVQTLASPFVALSYHSMGDARGQTVTHILVVLATKSSLLSRHTRKKEKRIIGACDWHATEKGSAGNGEKGRTWDIPNVSHRD